MINPSNIHTQSFLCMHNFYSTPELNKKKIFCSKRNFRFWNFFHFPLIVPFAAYSHKKAQLFSIFWLFIFKYMHLLLSLMTGKTTEYCIQVSYKRKLGVNSMYDFDFLAEKKLNLLYPRQSQRAFFRKSLIFCKFLIPSFWQFYFVCLLTNWINLNRILKK